MLRKLLDRPIAVTMIAVVLLILGIVSSRLLPVSLVPDVDAPYITVQIPRRDFRPGSWMKPSSPRCGSNSSSCRS